MSRSIPTSSLELQFGFGELQRYLLDRPVDFDRPPECNRRYADFDDCGGGRPVSSQFQHRGQRRWRRDGFADVSARGRSLGGFREVRDNALFQCAGPGSCLGFGGSRAFFAAARRRHVGDHTASHVHSLGSPIRASINRTVRPHFAFHLPPHAIARFDLLFGRPFVAGVRHKCGKSSGAGTGLPVILEPSAQPTAAQRDDGVGAAHRPEHARAL